MERNEDTMTAAGHPDPPPTPQQATRRGLPAGAWIALLVLAVLILVAIGVRMLERSHAEHTLATHADETAVMTV